MKKIFFWAVLLCSLQGATAQYMGMRGGFNYATLRGEVANEASVGGSSAFYVGLVLEVPFSKLFSLQGEALFNRTGAKIQSPVLGSSMLHLDYLSFPALARFNITKAFNIHLGPQFSFLINKSDFIFEDGQSITSVDQRSIDPFDMSLLVGAGFTSYSGWFVEARWGHGVSNVFERHPSLSATGFSRDYLFKNSVLSVGVGYTF